ncbi:hypothetical protein AA106_15775 [Photorhabdus laumondii subsp. laumondii]|uniref:hypothetical protein n=1 Tax=Photorhabdus laumondii TaxID=2218628 RepID=UPI00073375C0|nr:hypothetical protein [Photorhabdus laumondii]KTL59771.1 hypothetical protein AA106_15775 [Photorhabdus laumondii subsp. laumondii]
MVDIFWFVEIIFILFLSLINKVIQDGFFNNVTEPTFLYAHSKFFIILVWNRLSLIIENGG